MKKVMKICSLVTLCIVLMLSSCSKPAQQASDTLSIMIWDSYQEPGIGKLLQDFTDQTGIKTAIQVVKWDEYWTLLSAGAQGGTLPDVFWMHSNEAERYMSNNMLLDLTDYIAESSIVDMDNFFEDITQLYTHDGRYYAIPKDIDTVALWYNKKLFDNAGVSYPTADWTWEDVYDAAKKLTTPDGKIYGFCMMSSNNHAGYYNNIYANNGYIISDDKKKSGYDDPRTIEAMEFIEKMIQEKLLPPMEVMSETGEDVLFQSGQIAMLPAGSWMLPAYGNNEYTLANCDVAELPRNAATGRKVSVYNGLGWAISAKTPNAENAWKLLEYLGSKEAQEKQAQLGITMSAYKGTSDAWANSVPQFNLQAYLNVMNDMEIRPYSRQTVIWEKAVNDCFKKAWVQEISMREACLQAAAEMNKILAEE